MAFQTLPGKITAKFSPAYKRQEDEWKMIDALMGGTGEIRNWSILYLPQLENETDSNYKKRLAKAVLFPGFKRAVNFSVGKAFYKPIEIVPVDEKTELSLKMQAIIQDADRKNNNFGKFANDGFKQSFSKGLGYIYVEADAFDPEKVKTQAEFEAAGIRPYLIFFQAQDVLDVEMNKDGKITYCKLLERYTDFDEDQGVTVEKTRIRVVTQSEIAIYERTDETPPNVQNDRIIVSESDVYLLSGDVMKNNLGEVPLIPVYTGEKRSDFDCASPLLDLAYTNVQYYQDESTHENAIAYAEFPILFLKGSDGKNVTIGANKMITINDPAADLKYVEHSGAALEAGRKNLEELRNKMAYCGLKTLMGDSAASGSRQKTATEAEIENVDQNSELKVAADNFVDAINMALYYCQRYLGEIKANEQATVKAQMFGVFSITESDVKEVAALMELHKDGQMRLETLYREMKRRGMVADDFDIASEVEAANENAMIPTPITPMVEA